MRFSLILFSVISFFLTFTQTSKAVEMLVDPQYIVMNFATINEMDWGAQEAQWQETIKPRIVAEVTEMRDVLEKSDKKDSKDRLLAWSTLMEYMNFPLDDPSPTSVYAIKTKRILEIADELDFPVFLPLNGFQWWDQLPELYNWWDEDGTHTDPKFFSRQKNPEEFKKRFIAGYNPENKWNVEWQSWETPMKLNYRNWGGGGFRLAPPPNLVPVKTDGLTYHKVLTSRMKVILEQVLPFLTKWESENRLHLFAGISIGTEISLNASTKPNDEFIPYGYRSVQNLICPEENKTCGAKAKIDTKQIQAARRTAVENLLLDLTHRANTIGIPNQRIYTHVWSEALPNEPRYENYAASAYTLYSRPGMSFYGYSTDPLSLINWKNEIKESGYPAWGAVEYSAGNSVSDWKKGLTNSFDNQVASAKILVVYNWQEHKNTGAVAAIRDFLQKPVKIPDCSAPTVFPLTQHSALGPDNLSWKVVGGDNNNPQRLHIKWGIKVAPDSPNVYTVILDSQQNNVPIPELRPGTYSWYIEMDACNKTIRSEPRVFIHLPKFENNNSKLTEWILDTIDAITTFGRSITPKRI